MQTLPAGSDLWQRVLDVYNNATYVMAFEFFSYAASELACRWQPVVYKDPASGKMVFFTTYSGANPDPSLVAAVESNGGRNNVMVVPMWAEFDVSNYK